MAVIRINKTKNYTVMSNHHLKNKNMSLKAKGLLSLMLSLPDNWDYSVSGLIEICLESKTVIQNALKELENLGYLQRTRTQDSKGLFRYIYDIFEQPQPQNPQTENPFTDNPCTENRQQLNTKELNTKELNTNNKRESIREKVDSGKQSCPPPPSVDYQGIVDLYNETCVSLPSVRSLTDKRKRALKARLKNYSIEDLKKVFQKAEKSSFLNGSTDKWSGATFDWLIKEDNIVKVLEGNYDDKPKQQQSSGSPMGLQKAYTEEDYAEGWD